MRKTLAVLVAVGALFGTALPAHAVTYPATPGWESPAHMAPVGTICFEHANGKVLGAAIRAAAAGWNKSDLTVVSLASCAAYPRRRVVKFTAYYNSKTNAYGTVTECAMFSAGGYAWVSTRGHSVWEAVAPIVKVNYSAVAVKQCMNTSGRKTAMISHETGHYFGLTHYCCITVMNAKLSSTYTVPTIYDLRILNGRY